jgi:ATP phosphoribosyltransferase regulatory subunit
VRRRRALEAALTSTLRAWSYEEVLLPLLDYQEVFERGAGHGAGSRMYRLIDPEGHVLAVRPDLTPLVAKLAATSLGDAPPPIRLYYAGDVVRPEAPKALGQGEFHQVGFEQIGGERGAADLEVAVVALEALAGAGLGAPRMTLAHSAVLPTLCERASLPAEAAARVHERLSRRDAAGLEKVLSGVGAGSALRGAFGALLEGTASEEACGHIGRQGGPAAQRALRDLRGLHRDLATLGYAGRVEIDLADVGGFDYYTGVCFRVYADGVGFPIGGGGRYDRLLGRFGEDRAAIGFSFGLDRVLRALEAAGEAAPGVPAGARAVRVGSGGRLKAMREALSLRRRGERVRLC